MTVRSTQVEKLSDIAKVIRSKNAGPFEITFDIMFDDAASYERVKRWGGIEKHRIAALGHTQTAQRQHQRRSVRFFRGADGMVGLSGLLPPLEGQQLKEKLCALVDARWREAHPERAATLGGHGGDTPEQRMADALLEVTGVTGVTAPEWQGESPDSTTIAGARTDDDRNLIASDPSDSPGPGPKGTTSSGTTVRTAKPSVVIVFDIDRYEASILGHGPIPVTASLFDPVKNDLYYHYRNSVGEVLRFGRARKHPSVIQKLAVIVRDRHCQYPGCTAPPEACEIHHFNEWLQDHGLTNVESLGLFCRPHHRHVHVEDLVAIRERDGTVSIRHRRTGSLIARARGVDR